jgi:small conductance mechanosensitive channel
MKWIEEIFGIKYTDINQFLVKVGTNLLISIVILVVGFWLAKMLSKGLKRLLRKSNTDEGLVTFSSSFVSMVLKVLVVVTAITQLGIEMTSFVAILGAAGLAIGMAFSGTLSNFAGGVMILVLKPFKVGDTVLIQGEKGIVREIQIFNTYLYTGDNKVIILPNGPVANGNITNFTKADKRRVDTLFFVSVEDDLEKAKQIIQEILKKDQRIHTDPPYFIGVESSTSGAVQLVVRVWASTDDHSDVFYHLNETILGELKNAGFHFPLVTATPSAIK